MRRYAASLFIIAATALAYTSCKQSTPETEQEEAASSNSICFETRSGSATFRLTNSAADFEQDSDLTYFDSVNIIMPTSIYEHDITALRDTILKVAFDTIAPDFDDAMSKYFIASAGEAGYTPSATSNAGNLKMLSDGMTIVDGKVFSMTDRILTYRVSNYTYPPRAAHGITENRYITYDMKRGGIITLNSVFTADGLTALPAVIAKRAKQMKAQLGETSITALPMAGNFCVDIDGNLSFIYAPFEVASYAQGEISVSFYPYELSDYLTPLGRDILGLQ